MPPPPVQPILCGGPGDGHALPCAPSSSPGHTKESSLLHRAHVVLPLSAQAWLIAIVALVSAVRVGHFAALADSVWMDLPRVFIESDMHHYLKWANEIRAGDLLGRQTYHPFTAWMAEQGPRTAWDAWWGGREVFQQAPAYPYGLAAALTLTGGSLVPIVFLQLLVGGALQVLVTFALARRLFSDAAALVAAALAGLYGPWMFVQGSLLRDGLQPLVEAAALWLLLRARDEPGARAWLLAGFAMGVGVLAKDTSLLFVPVALGWLAWSLDAPPRTRLRAVAMVVAGLAIGWSPLIARNVAVGAPALAVSNRFAEAFIQGNAADGDPIGLRVPASLPGILARADGHPAAVVRETLATWQGDTMALAAHLLRKTRAVFDPFEVPDNLSWDYAIELSPLLALLPTFGLLLPLAAAGALAATQRRRQGGHGLIGLWLLVAVAGLIVPIVVGRYRLVLVPVLATYAGSAIVTAWQAGVQRQWRSVAGVVGVVALAVGLQQAVIPLASTRAMGALVVHPAEYVLSARLYADRGEFDRAIDEARRYRHRAAQSPRFRQLGESATLFEAEMRVRKGRWLARQGDLDGAALQAAHVDRLYRHAPLADPHPYALATLWSDMGQGARAAVLFRAYLEHVPDGEFAGAARRALAGAPAAPPPRMLPP